MFGLVEKRYEPLAAAMVGLFVVFGVLVTLTGAALPAIIRGFGWSYIPAGAVIAARSTGYLVSSFGAGLLLGRLGLKPTLCAGLCLQAIGLALFGWTGGALINGALNFVSGLGLGCTEVVVNVCVLRMERPGSGRLMNLTHAGFCVGAVVGPLGVAALLAGGQAWQVSFRVMAGISAAMAAALALLSFAPVLRPSTPASRRPPIGRTLRQPLLLLCSAILLLYVGAEIGVAKWVSEYFVVRFDWPGWAAGIMPAVFWSGLLAGRLGVSYFHRSDRQDRLLVQLAVACAASTLVAVSMPWAPAAAAVFFLAGLGYSAIYPTTMTLVGRHCRGERSVGVGAAATGGGLGSLSIPLAMSAIAEYHGVTAGFAFYVAVNAFMLAAILTVRRLVRLQE